MVNAEFSRIYRFVKLLVNEGFLAVIIGTKYQKQVAQTTQLLTMFNSTTLNSAGKCMIQVANPRIKQKHKIN